MRTYGGASNGVHMRVAIPFQSSQITLTNFRKIKLSVTLIYIIFHIPLGI
jgi:hypothetical protein